MNFDGTTDDALGQRVVVFKIVHRVLRVLCVSVSSVFKQTRRLRSCMTSSRAVGRCVRHRGHRDTEDTEEFRDFASTTLPTTDGRICCLAITAGAPRAARFLFVYTLSDLGLQPGRNVAPAVQHAPNVDDLGTFHVKHEIRKTLQRPEPQPWQIELVRVAWRTSRRMA